MKQILITGCTRGLGYALLKVYADCGWKVFAVVRELAPIASLREEHHDAIVPICCDVTDSKIEEKIRESLQANQAELSVLINNAGSGGRKEPSIQEIEPAFLSSMIHTHCIGALSVSRAALPFLTKRKSAIVNVSSRLGSATRNGEREYSGFGFSYTYRIAKASQNMATLCMSQDHQFEEITVCAMHPGRLKTASGTPEADTEPSIAAERMKARIGGLTNKENGSYIDLENGDIPW